MPTEDEKLEQAFGDLLTNLNSIDKVELTDEEWMSVIARDRDGLPPCCGNISSLRDALVSIALDDGRIEFWNRTKLAQRITWCFPSHDVPSGAVQKILDQLGYTHPDIERHVPDQLEM